MAATDVPWEAVYETHATGIARYLRRVVRDPETALDLTQETFVRAMRAGRRPPLSEMRPWLYRIASNLALDHLRRPRLATLFGTRERSASDASLEDADHVRRALRSIAADQAVALTLAFHEGFSRREIADMLGCSEGTVKSRIARGRLAFVAAYARLERGLRA